MAATIKLDDLLGKKKDAPQVLDLSKSVVESKEDFRRLMDRVPEYKIRPEKVRPEELKTREKLKYSFNVTKRESRHQGDYSYANPVPPDMRGVKLEDLSPVPIDWKMLTSVRPKLKLEEEMFSRMVLLGKLHLRTAAREKRSSNLSLMVRSHKNRAGILERRAMSCAECGEEFCSGYSCTSFLYECFYRVDNMAVAKLVNQDMEEKHAKPKQPKKKRKKRKKAKKKKKKKGKKSEEKKDTDAPES